MHWLSPTSNMTTTTIRAQPGEAGKQKGVFKKVLRYLQDQAVENSNPRSFLSPPGLEPHQKIHYCSLKSGDDHDRAYIRVPRRLSDATTAVEPRQLTRRPRPMAVDGVDASVFHDTVSRSKEMKKVQYAQDNILQNYRIYVPERDPETIKGNQFWIIYIHGGYFRDPKIDAATFGPALEVLTDENFTTQRTSSRDPVSESVTTSSVNPSGTPVLGKDLVREHIAGYASINYRLSPNPTYPQDDRTENYVRRNAQFPQQLQDVHAAIRHLQTRHDIGTNYILAGHSVGATLAFLAALKTTEGQIDPPACVIGLNGIYDFPAVHITHPDYEHLTKNAISPDQYQAASPALYARSDYLSILPKKTFKVLLSQSRDDGLVDWAQVEAMMKTLHPSDNEARLQVELLETKGQHDAIWGNGRELARTLVEALQMVTEQR